MIATNGGGYTGSGVFVKDDTKEGDVWEASSFLVGFPSVWVDTGIPSGLWSGFVVAPFSFSGESALDSMKESSP